MACSYETVFAMKQKVHIGMTSDEVWKALHAPYQVTYLVTKSEMQYRNSQYQVSIYIDLETDRVIAIETRPLTQDEQAAWRRQAGPMSGSLYSIPN